MGGLSEPGYSIRYIAERAAQNRVSLYGIDFRGADLQYAELPGTDLRNANLQGANLEVANLKGADLRWANFQGANLFNANLKGTDVRWTNFRGADLRWANFEGTTFWGMKFEGCHMNWQSHDLIAARLRQEADKTHNSPLYGFAAGYILVNRDYRWCWKRLLEYYPEGDKFDKIKSWALKTMQSWSTDESPMPEIKSYE